MILLFMPFCCFGESVEFNIKMVFRSYQDTGGNNKWGEIAFSFCSAILNWNVFLHWNVLQMTNGFPMLHLKRFFLLRIGRLGHL